MTITCPAAKRIEIVSALHGRTKQGVCGHKGNINCGNAKKSMKVAKRECQGQPNCTLHAGNSAFEDPCEGTVKYLEVGSKRVYSFKRL